MACLASRDSFYDGAGGVTGWPIPATPRCRVGPVSENRWDSDGVGEGNRTPDLQSHSLARGIVGRRGARGERFGAGFIAGSDRKRGVSARVHPRRHPKHPAVAVPGGSTTAPPRPSAHGARPAPPSVETHLTLTQTDAGPRAEHGCASSRSGSWRLGRLARARPSQY